MNNIAVIILALFISIPISNQTMHKTIYDFTVSDITGAVYSLSKLKGKKVMIVNTASACGLTPQYEGLQKLYETYKDLNFVIIGFPANNFMKQEPGTNDEISEFCKINYGVSFPMMSKIDVIGENQHPLYTYLNSKELNGHSTNEVEWNFQKYLINHKGLLEKVLSPRVEPLSEEITNWITQE